MGAVRKSSRRGLVRELDRALKNGPEAFLEFVERHSIPEPNSGCWLWERSFNGFGYPFIVDPRKPIHRAAMPRVGVHRLVCEVLHRPMLDEEHARHLCHNRACVNPIHLVPGSASDNVQDSVRAGHYIFTRGSGNGRAKMSEADVLLLRREFRRFTAGETAKWAAKFGVDPSNIREAVAGRSWRHVTQEAA